MGLSPIFMLVLFVQHTSIKSLNVQQPIRRILTRSCQRQTQVPSSRNQLFLSGIPRVRTTQLKLNVDYLDETVQIGAGARSSLNCEVDYLGIINFCLRASDNGLSGPSTFKVMNEATNDVFRVIMMGYEPATDLLLLGFASYKALIEDEVDRKEAEIYLSWLEKILINGEIVETSTEIDIAYSKGYQRLVEVLRDAGCAVYPSKEGRPKPEFSNICLSILDLSRPVGASSRTIELNKLSNSVSKVCAHLVLKNITTFMILSEIRIDFKNSFLMSTTTDSAIRPNKSYLLSYSIFTFSTLALCR